MMKKIGLRGSRMIRDIAEYQIKCAKFAEEISFLTGRDAEEIFLEASGRASRSTWSVGEVLEKMRDQAKEKYLNGE